MRVIPAIDMLGGRVVRLRQGDYDDVTAYGTSLNDQIRAWVEAGAGIVHVVDLDGARSGVPTTDIWEEAAQATVPVQIGGGIRTADQVVAAVSAGISRVMMGTAAVWDPTVLADVVDRVGPGAVVAAVDVADGRARGQGWLDEGKDLDSVVGTALSVGVERLLVTSVSRDGTLDGPDLALLAAVRHMAPDAQIVAAGGIASIDDVGALERIGIDEAVVGRALYEGGIDLSEILDRFGA